MAGDIEEIFPILLAAQDDVKALAGDRFFPNRIPQRDKMPAVTFERVGGSPINNAGGVSAVSWATFRLTSWSAQDQQQAQVLNKAVQAIKTGSKRVGDWWVQSLRIAPGTSMDEPQTPQHGEDRADYSSSTEFTVFYKRGATS